MVAAAAIDDRAGTSQAGAAGANDSTVRADASTRIDKDCDHVVELRQVGTRFGNHVVHDKLDLSVRRGEILGPSARPIPR